MAKKRRRNFYCIGEIETPATIRITHEQIWAGKPSEIPDLIHPELTTNRTNSKPSELKEERQYILTWLNHDYAIIEIKRTIMQLKTKNAEMMAPRRNLPETLKRELDSK